MTNCDIHRAVHCNIISVVKPTRCTTVIKFILFWNDTLHLISTPTNVHIYIFFFTKTFKIAPTCFDAKIIFRELHYSLVKSNVTLVMNSVAS